jgi:hypothetical protein
MTNLFLALALTGVVATAEPSNLPVSEDLSDTAEATETEAFPEETQITPGGAAQEASSLRKPGTPMDELLKRARMWVLDAAFVEYGKSYHWGGTGPNSWDCSGLVYGIYRRLGFRCPRTASAQYLWSIPIRAENMRAGDLVFFGPTPGSRRLSHVGIYIGGGLFIHASSGHHRVVISSLMAGTYFKRYRGAGRVLLSEEDARTLISRAPARP